MFERFRFCDNPDCQRKFEADSPLADCCNKRCTNRKGYLKRLAKKNLGKTASKQMIRAYMIIKCLKDKRMLRPDIALLKKMGVDFKSLPSPIQYAKGDTKSTYQIGDLAIVIIDEHNAAIVKQLN